MGILYSKLKMFHFKEKLDSLPLENPQILPPLHVRVKPTNICNHDCWYCAYRRDTIQLGKDMVVREQIPETKMMELVDDFIDMGVKAMTFSGGGDPLCYPYLAKTAQRLAEADIKIATLTNGALLTGEIAETFAARGSWIRVSVDGWDSRSYAEYRGVSEKEFERVITNLTEFRKRSTRCLVGVVIIVDSKNHPYVYDLIRRFHDMGVHSVKIAPCFTSNDGDENNRYHEPHFNLVKEQIQRAISEFQSASFEIFDSYYAQLCTFHKEYDWCPYIQINPVVGADMNVYSCHDKAYNLDSGLLFSIKERRFKEMWLADKQQFMTIKPRCHCNHHCVVNDKNKMILEYLNLDRGHLEFV
jgi:sulfatase maturation enzyme AslB (radical SAM superfamily)